MELPIGVLAVALLCILTINDDVVNADPVKAPLNISTSNDTLQSIHKRLVQHTKTLEKMLTMVQHNQDLTKKIIKYLNRELEEPETHSKIKIFHPNDSPYPFDGEYINNNHESGYIGSKSGVYKSQKYSVSKDDNSIWCAVAVKCKSTSHSVCGFDEYFGLAKFNDICQMLQINCYMRYNFSVAAC